MQIIKKFNNLYTENECSQIANFFYSCDASWKLTGYSNDNDDYDSSKVFWHHDLIDYGFFSEDSVNRIQNIVGFSKKLDRVYANGHCTGQEGDWHIDNDKDGTVTVLWYLQNFEEDWAGKTCFKVDGEEYAYTPEKNTFIVFPSNIEHKGEAPNQKFNGVGKLRITIAWKFSN